MQPAPDATLCQNKLLGSTQVTKVAAAVAALCSLISILMSGLNSLEPLVWLLAFLGTAVH